ncbi:hypothetical protein FEE95_14350 [Maribacter algarum]|uniref:Uncharacterized protein n=1 Tax=Maribacter algarum (ex Zhang et al. 2020) TaxID=2578118 RepID=A0A5S3PMY6_9FLAO|nr:hypothetical protein [Maribacter algarum]TMM55832.1 hypothetical protein FEE95_14350 [Maribacter algarum]
MKKSKFHQHLSTLNILKATPKITLRFLNFLLQRKKMTCKDFRPNSSYCIEGTLNQLIWEVKNALFITVSNSSKIFFDSDELLFQANSTQTQFELCAYGIGYKEKLRTQIKVVVLEKIDLTNVVLNSNNIAVEFNKILHNHNIRLQHIQNHSISFQKSLMPKSPEKRRVQFQRPQFLDQYSVALFNTHSIKEVQKLRELIEENQEVAQS